MALSIEQLHRIKIAKIKPFHLRNQDDWAYLQLELDDLKNDTEN